MKFDTSKVYVVLEYLQVGGKVKMKGRTYLWLDNHVVNETENEKWVIDGLAIETRSYGPGEDWKDPNAGKPYFMGRGDMSLTTFFHLIENIHPDEFLRVCLDLNRIRQSTNS